MRRQPGQRKEPGGRLELPRLERNNETEGKHNRLRALATQENCKARRVHRIIHKHNLCDKTNYH